jgi:hypothetical protein
MTPVSTVRAPQIPTADEDAGPQHLGIMLVATPVAAARWQTHVVKGTHVVERVAERDDLDDQMSRRHSTVRRRGDHLTVRDGAALDGGAWKPSSNGTHGPDGALLTADEEVVLHRGDTFRTGQSLWVVIENPTPPMDPDTLLQGPSPSMQRLREEIAVVVAMVAARLRRGARVHQALLVTGPRGSGKQVVAQEAHRLLCKQLGSRQTPFRQVAAPSLADGTVAADLFGVVDGYATGTKGRSGYFVQAHRGILLLDEVGDTPASAQARLLNALQEREVTPLGGRTPIPFDCLVIGATNRELKTVDDDESSARGVESGQGCASDARIFR